VIQKKEFFFLCFIFLFSNDYTYVGVAVRKHPSQDYVAVLAVSTPVYEDL
jgi:hypothetical protein